MSPPSTLYLVLDDAETSLSHVAAALLASNSQKQLHSLYIAPTTCGTVHHYGARLAAFLADPSRNHSKPTLARHEITALRHLRGSYAFRATTDPRVSLHTGESLENWTLICEEDPLFAESCAPGQVYIKPTPDDWDSALLFIRQQITSVALWPYRESDVPKVKSDLQCPNVYSMSSASEPRH